MSGHNHAMSGSPTIEAVSRKAKVRPAWVDEFNRRLDLALATRKMRRQGLSKAICITPASVSGWKKESAPSLDNLMAISDLLGVSVDWLLGRGSDQLPAASAQPIPMDRAAVSIAANAVADLISDSLKLPASDDIAAMILRTHDWVVSMRRQDGALPGIADTANFLRHALQFAKD